MSLTRGRITGSSGASGSSQGREDEGTNRRGEEARVTAATFRVAAAFSVAAAVCLLAVVAVTGRADGAASQWATYLAPESACGGATDAGAPVATQKRAVACLLNWARTHARLARLTRRAQLGRAARLKGRKVAACRDFSHSPCGVDPRAPLARTGYRYETYGENLLLGAWATVTPREAVALWLQSPGHRANILRPGFRDLGAALVRAHGLRTSGDAALWVTAFATPR